MIAPVTPHLIRSSILDRFPKIRYAFGTALDRAPAWFLASAEKPRWKQVHGTTVVDVSRHAYEAGDVDGFVTQTTTPIGIVTADCLPILAVTADGSDVAAVHAGWRGLEAGILDFFGRDSKKEWHVVIGPAIRACCYEVSDDLIERFRRTFPALSSKTVSPAPRKLDLAHIADKRLRQLRVREIEVLPHCTQCSESPRFESYRRDHGVERQYSVIQRL